MDKDYLVLKRASASRQSGEWNEDDFDVLADGIVVGRILSPSLRPQECPGCGPWLSGTMRVVTRRTAMLRRAKPRWRHSRRAGEGTSYTCTETHREHGLHLPAGP